MPRDRVVSLCLFASVTLFALGGFLTLRYAPFPSQYDELQHVSFIAAMRDTPRLFPQYGAYRVLTPDLARWTETINYIAHPPLFYLLLAPFSDNVVLLRAVDLLMALAGFALCAQAGVRLLATPLQRCAFLLMLLVFSKPLLIAGMVNNDNLVLLETGLLLWLLAQIVTTRRIPHPEELAEQASRSMRRGFSMSSFETPLAAAPQNEVELRERDNWQAFAIAFLLAAVGWTKFNAFVGLTLWVGLLHVASITRGQNPLFGRASFVLLAGLLAGAIPTLANIVAFGAVAYVPVDFLYVEPAARLPYDFAGFAAAFFHRIGVKVLFADGVADMLPAIIAIVLVAGCAMFARSAPSRTRDIAVAAWSATLVFAALHVAYGFASFRALGTLSDAQSRYYVMLWPGLALATVLGGAAIAQRIANAGATEREDAALTPPARAP